MAKKTVLIFLLAVISLNFFFIPAQSPSPSAEVERYFRQGLTATIRKIDEITIRADKTGSSSEIQNAYLAARSAYKQIEFLVEYYYPYLVRKINGPPLPYTDGENSLGILQPAGFQVIEEMIFPTYDVTKKDRLTEQVRLLAQTFEAILQQADPYNFQDRYIFDAMRLEVFRLIALGITGFDSQLAYNAIPEAGDVLRSLKSVLSLYLPATKDSVLVKELAANITGGVIYIRQHKDFNHFDRLHFIMNYADPLSEKLLQVQKKLRLLLPGERRILSPMAPHLFAGAYLSNAGYSPNSEADPTADKVALGKKLFFDTILSVNLQRSCGTCHQPGKAFTDGLPRSMQLDTIHTVLRNAPTLWNAAFQPKQFYDSRAVFMEHQVFEVVHSDKEMGGSMQLVLPRIKHDSAYSRLFMAAYAYSQSPLSEDNITNAIASYLRSLVSLNSRFDRFINGSKNLMNREEQKGFNLFMGKAKCATCHFAPLFNGVAPPYFSEAESEVIGVPATTDTVHPVIDPDVGKFGLYPVSILKYAFKTSTLRNIGLTAPYMHNGVYKTLEEVIDFYNKGGGTGLGLSLPNQTLPTAPLNLSPAEKKQIIAFLHTLTDTTATH